MGPTPTPGDAPRRSVAADPRPGTGIRLTTRDRIVAWLVTGPVGRLAAFVADLAAAWWGWARARVRSARDG